MKPSPSYAPVYAALYPELAEVFQRNGYALAVHGSLQRDFDVVGIPWVESPSTPGDVIKQIVSEFALRQIGVPAMREHGRQVYTLSIGHGSCFLDMSFMPLTQEQNQ